MYARQGIRTGPLRARLQLVVHVRAVGIAGVAEQAKYLSLCDAIARANADQAMLQVRDHAELTVAMIDHQIVAGSPPCGNSGTKYLGSETPVIGWSGRSLRATTTSPAAGA